MQQTIKGLPLPEEPTALKTEARTLVEESPERGTRRIDDAEFVAAPLWEEWEGVLEGLGMDYDRFLEVARGYRGEIRLWVVGERPWEHCASGLAGRVGRRLPASGSGRALESEKSLACAEVRG